MKKILFFFLLMLTLGFCGIFLTFHTDTPPAPDMAVINDAVMTAMQKEHPEDAVNLLNQQLQQESERMDMVQKSRNLRLQIFLYIFVIALGGMGLCLYLYCQRSILLPFHKLQQFAHEVAAGNLDFPLEMDRCSRFGAFTESFDLMREELKKARENERNADRRKKELVASLSHDIKTPIASIKAVTELMLVTAVNEKEKVQLEGISAKAEQINTLITDMFHATLEELQAFSVAVTEITSTTLPGLIGNADYNGLVTPFVIPDCIVLGDPIRLQQILDNIIGNSYKYADTAIEIHADFQDTFLVIQITDFGSGVPDDDLPLLFNKFYRGKNAEEKSGYGLGLYISKYLLSQMSGSLSCENCPAGFMVKLMLRLAE